MMVKISVRMSRKPSSCNRSGYLGSSTLISPPAMVSGPPEKATEAPSRWNFRLSHISLGFVENLSIG